MSTTLQAYPGTIPATLDGLQTVLQSISRIRLNDMALWTNLSNSVPNINNNPYTNLAKVPAFAAFSSSTHTVPSSTYTLANFESVNFDNLSNYNNTSGNYSFTAPTTGIYDFNVLIVALATVANSNFIVILYKNGSIITEAAQNSSATFVQQSMTLNTLLSLTAGDVVQAYIYQDSGTTITFTLPEFHGYFVSN